MGRLGSGMALETFDSPARHTLVRQSLTPVTRLALAAGREARYAGLGAWVRHGRPPMTTARARISRDTSADVQERMDAHYRAMSPLAKLELQSSLTASATAMARARLQSDDPDADEDVIEERLRALIWPPALHQAFFAARRRWLQEQR
jgi:hypothetical protein